MRLWIILIGCALTWQAHADMLDTRLAGFASQTQSKVRFSETFTASYLNKPIVSFGTMEYQAPDRLTKIITKPEKIRYSIQQNILRVQRGNDVQQINLDKQPLLGMGINALRDLLQGDRQDLEKRFWTTYNPDAADPDKWQLLLIPRDKTLLKRVNRVVMRGLKNQLQELVIEYNNGDRMVTRITADE